jgi:hypothetical protein
MHTDYVPQSYGNLKTWLIKQDDLDAELAATLKMTPEERTTYLAAVTAVRTPVTAIVDLMEQLEMKTADFPLILAQQLPLIRAAINRVKTSGALTPAIQLQLGWVGETQDNDPETSRPTITVTAQPGRVKIEGRKPGFESVSIYSRKKGEVQWKLIAVRKRKFPFYDESPLAVAGVPEVREYMARGVVDDEEVGEASEIKEVVFAG